MNKRGRWILWTSIILVFLLIIGLFIYFSLAGPDYTKNYEEMNISNPTEGKSLEDSVLQFNESFVYYLLYRIKAYNLHNPPLSEDKPKIKILVDEKEYYAVIDSGTILVGKNKVGKEDVIIRTTGIESVKMIKDKNYVKESFEKGISSIELVAEKAKLFAKGYLKLYDEINGGGITGKVVKIYTS